jgi:integrase
VARIDLKYACPVKDRYGKSRWYFRFSGKNIRLHGEPGSGSFMADYHDAMGKIEPPSSHPHMRAGSVAAAIALYLNSADFLGLAPATRADRQRVLTSLARSDRGGLPFARMESQDVERLLADKTAAPHAAKNLLKSLRGVAKVAVKMAMIAKDPTTGVKVHAPTSEAGFKMWEESDIAQFEVRWPIGSRERLAFALLLYTGQRRGDIIRLGPQHERGGFLELHQGKTGARCLHSHSSGFTGHPEGFQRRTFGLPDDGDRRALLARLFHQLVRAVGSRSRFAPGPVRAWIAKGDVPALGGGRLHRS